MRDKLREGTRVKPGVRRLVMLFVMLVFSGIYLMAGPASADPDPDGSKTAVTANSTCAEMGGEVNAETGECTGVKTKEIPNAIEKNRVSVNLLWLMVAGGLVFFMQAGFAMVETGFCRKKHAAHVVMTNYMVFGTAALAFAAVGYSFMFGSLADIPYIGFKGFGESLVGGGNWQFLSWGGFALTGDAYDVGVLAFFFFQLVFMDTMATIPTGAMAERWKFSAFVVFAFFAGGIIYPIIGNWVWGGGWLSSLGKSMGLGQGALDFAGSGVVHAVGGITGLMGAIVLGPRIGKFNKDGSPNAMPGHNIPMGIFGVIILFFGWIGFNGGSTFAASDLRFTVVIVNTILAGCAGAVSSMFLIKRKFGKFDPSMAANGGLAGLVAITAPAAFTNPQWSMLIGLIAGVLVVYSILAIEKLGVDDPVGAVSVHGVCGLFGVLAVGLFADGTYAFGANSEGAMAPVKGLVTGETGQLFAQLIYAATLIVVVSAVTFAFFKIQDKIQGIRSDEAEELQGLDIPEMGVEAYPEELEVAGVYAGTTKKAASIDVSMPKATS